ncbi:MAG: histidine kinase N-terminal 7TM domain-containing protein [Candidatus Thermoplasmatota archaeon]
MYIKYLLYLLPIILAVLITLFLVKQSFERRDTAVGRYFFYLSCAMLFWAVSYLLELVLFSPELYIYFSRMKYLGVISVPIFWFIFALLYSGKIEFMSRRKLIALSILPAFHFIILLTNPFHNLFFVEEVHTSIGPLKTSISVAGPIFHIHTYYSYGLIVAGILVMLQEAIRLKDLYLKQSLVLITGILMPFIANIVSVFNLLPYIPENYYLTVLMFSLSGITIWYALFKLKFLDILPIARDEVFDNISDSIFVLDPQNRVMDYNQEAEKMLDEGVFPRGNEDIMGKKIDKLFSETPEIIEKHKKIEEAHDEIKFSRKERWYDVKLTSFYNKKEEFIGRILIFRDITKRKQAEEKAEFLHSLLRHDLGNKLQLTMGFLELLQDADISGEDREFLEDSLSSIEEGIELIENVRTLQKIESDKKGGEIEPVKLKKIIEESVVRYDDLRKQLGFDINNHIDEEIIAQGGKILKELFANLVENSLKHSGGSRIDISSTQNEGKVKIIIEDDGKGIPDDIKESITEKGSQGEDSSGSGLGMHLVKNIAETYGGSLEVKDSRLGGARFVIILNKYSDENEKKI